MKRVCVVCEGQTEEIFVRDVLAPSLHSAGLNLLPEMVEHSPGRKGGALVYDRVKRHIRNTLRQSSAPIVTTLIDLYRLDVAFPGFGAAAGKIDLRTRLQTLTDALHADIVTYAECRPERFIPYIQPYEFEALLFSDIDTLVAFETSWQHAKAKLGAARAAAKSPEHINDGPTTKPAARLESDLRNPSFRKTLHGPRIAQRIGLPRIEAECAFFAGWLSKLREVAASS